MAHLLYRQLVWVCCRPTFLSEHWTHKWILLFALRGNIIQTVDYLLFFLTSLFKNVYWYSSYMVFFDWIAFFAKLLYLILSSFHGWNDSWCSFFTKLLSGDRKDLCIIEGQRMFNKKARISAHRGPPFLPFLHSGSQVSHHFLRKTEWWRNMRRSKTFFF